MKTTVDISDRLLDEARQVAARDGLTLRSLIERGLYHVLRERTSGAPFKLRRATFRGSGRHPEFTDAAWGQVRDAIYRDRGA